MTIVKSRWLAATLAAQNWGKNPKTGHFLVVIGFKKQKETTAYEVFKRWRD